MANNSNINFEITARNNASGAIRTVSKDLGGLSGAASGAGLKLKAAMVGAGIAIAATTKFIVDSTRKAMEEEKIQSRLVAVMERRNMVTKDSLALIEQQVVKGRSLAFSSDEVRSSLASTIPFAKDMTTAQKIQTAAMDVAAAQNISLAKATMIVTRAYMGQGKNLVKLGIDTSKMVTVTKYKTVIDKAATAAAHKKIDALNKQRKAQGLEKLAYGESIKKQVAYTKQQKQIIKGDEVIALTMAKVGGTAEKTALSVEKQFKIFQLTIDDLQQSFGKAFLPIASKIAQVLNTKVLPAVTPVIEKATAFFTDNVPKMMASMDPLFDKVGSVIGKIGGIATAMWGEGNGPLGKAVLAVSDVLGKMLDTGKQILGLAPSATEAFKAYTAYREGERAPLNITEESKRRKYGVGPAFKGGRIGTGVSYESGIAPWQMPQPSAQAQSGVPDFLKKIPFIGDKLEGKGLGGAALGGALTLLPLLRGKKPNLGIVASGILGGYSLGSLGENAAPGDALNALLGGAGTAQAAVTLLPLLPALFGRGNKGTQAGKQPGLMSRLGAKLLPKSIATKLGMGGGPLGAVGGMGAMQMTAQNVYINAANVMGGMPGGMPGMPMGPSPLDLVGKPGAPTGLLAKLGGTRFGAPIANLLGSVANSRAANIFGKLGSVASKGVGSLGMGVPILGGLASGLNAAVNGKTLGQSLGNGIGTAAGSAIGAGLLSWIPVAGPLLGGTLGGALGGAIGEAIGGAIDPQVKKIQDTIKTIPSPAAYTTSYGATANAAPTTPYSTSYGTQNATLTVNLTLDGQKVASYIDKNLGAKWTPYGGSRTTPGAK